MTSKYNDRVRALAERFAREQLREHESTKTFDKGCTFVSDAAINYMLPLARIAVADEAEAIKRFPNDGYVIDTEQYLLNNGYTDKPQNDGE